MEKLTIRYHSEAKQELNDAVDWYIKTTDAQLPREFEQNVTNSIHAILESPKIWALQDNLYRRFNMSRFPFYLPYIIRGNSIIILAVAHVRRNPDYWKTRLRE